MIKNEHDIIFFDGVCNLCNGFVDFIIRHDKHNRFKFASLQSNYAREILNNFKIDHPLNSVVYIRSESCFTKSDAALLILKSLGFPFNLTYLFWFVPRFLRDGIYKLVASNRYLVFGKRTSCRIPSDSEKSKFLE
jgi:predicted DCC family thiol-disulfide oxidoreductase YuxK